MSLVDFEVSYIAENHENLNHILVFVSVNGVVAGTDVEAEVSPSLENSSFGSNRLIIKCGSQTSMPLALPGHVHCGKKEMRAQSGHYEIKLTTIPSTTPSPQPAPLLDAVQLSDWNPTTFVCDSCSLPVVHSSKISQYRDLPSEHWQELVDAWMCHPDQKLHDQVVQSGSKGFWPESGQALVGGSYILFEESAVSKTNIHARHSLKVSFILYFRTIKKAGVGLYLPMTVRLLCKPPCHDDAGWFPRGRRFHQSIQIVLDKRATGCSSKQLS